MKVKSRDSPSEQSGGNTPGIPSLTVSDEERDNTVAPLPRPPPDRLRPVTSIGGVVVDDNKSVISEITTPFLTEINNSPLYPTNQAVEDDYQSPDNQLTTPPAPPTNDKKKRGEIAATDKAEEEEGNKETKPAEEGEEDIHSATTLRSSVVTKMRLLQKDSKHYNMRQPRSPTPPAAQQLEHQQKGLLENHTVAIGLPEKDIKPSRKIPNDDDAGTDNNKQCDIFSTTPQPLPLPPNDRATPQVGAFAVQQPHDGSDHDHLEHLLLHDEEDPLPTTSSPTRTPTEGLAVANPVTENNESLPTAVPNSSRNKRGQQESNRTNRLMWISLWLSALIVVILVATLIPRKQRQSVTDSHPATATPATTNPPSSSKTLEPLSVEDSILSLFPEETTIKILENPDSPQAKAFEWLMEDKQRLPSTTKERIKQKFVLATLFLSTEGHNWRSSTNWLNHNVSECRWFNKPDFAHTLLVDSLYPGYLRDFFPPSEPEPTTCNDEGLYQHLWLDQNNLIGKLPDELYLLTSLKTLSLSFNKLEGSISTHVGQLTGLDGLVISWLTNGGRIPSQIGLLTSLRALLINDSNHQGYLPSEIWLLSKLDTFFYSSNPELKSTIPTEIGNFKKLRWLINDSCSLSGTIPTQIGLATTMEWMFTYSNQLTGTLPSQLAQLTRMISLSLFDNSLSGQIPSELGLVQEFSVMLHLGRNALGGVIPSELGLLTKLSTSLNLGNNELTGPIASQLGLLYSLTELELFNNGLSGALPSQLGKLASMERLTFANNSLSGSVPQELSALHHSLATLTLDGNPKLSGTVPAELCNLNGTCQISFVDPCEGPYGLHFDCGDLLCGCNCSCSS